MITITHEASYVSAAVFDQFTLQDYQELEQEALKEIGEKGAANLLFDLRQMQGYTVDVAFEDVRFTKAHSREFSRIAIVTDDQWVIWSAWLNRALAKAEIRVFEEFDEALEWVGETALQPES